MLCSEFDHCPDDERGPGRRPGSPHCYANLFPGGPAEHLQALGVATLPGLRAALLEREVPAAFLSFDEYPLVTNPGSSVRLIKDTWYEDLGNRASRGFRNENKKFWGFRDALTWCIPFRLCPILWLQLYSDLAYRAQVLQYFTLLDADGVGRLELSDGADRRRRSPYGDVRSGENRDE